MSLILYRALLDAGFSPRSYSGRGMYGKERLGFIPQEQEVSVIGAVAMIVSCATSDQAKEELVDVFLDACTDSLGRNTIVYFPNIPWDQQEMVRAAL